MTLLAITADLHVDDYAGIPGRFDDILRTVAWVARTARERGAAALVVAGDYSESRQPIAAARAVKIAMALGEGPDRQLHVRGNHDVAWRGTSIIDDLGRTAGWTGYTSSGFEIVDGVAICVIPYLDRSWARTVDTPVLLDGERIAPSRMTEAQLYRWLGDQYPVIAASLYTQATDAGARAAILVGHQQLGGGRMTEKQQAFLGDLDVVVDPRALAAIGFSAVVFGHVHRAQTLLDDPACPVLYVGSIERVDFAEELEEKSFVLLEVDPNGLVSIERVPTPARRYVTFDGLAGGINDRVQGAVVRVRNVPAGTQTRDVQRLLEGAGAFAVTSVTQAAVEAEAPVGGMDETLSAEEATAEYFADDPDRDALVELGREILAEVAA